MTLRFASKRLLTVAEARATRCGCIGANSPTDEVIEALIDATSDTLARVSGARVSGRRTVRARPCRTGCASECACCGADVIPLGDQDPGEIVVKIDGVTLTDAEVWLHRDNLGWVIARRSADGTKLRPWPSWQRRWLPDTEDHTFSVTFEQGLYADEHVIKAAALEVFCDFASDGSLMDNILDGVTSVQFGDANVTIDANRLAEAGDTRLSRIANGELGPMTRRMMGILAPSGRSAHAVWAPELMQGWELNLETVTA